MTTRNERTTSADSPSHRHAIGWSLLALSLASVPVILGSFTSLAPVDDPILERLRRGTVWPGIGPLHAMAVSVAVAVGSIGFLTRFTTGARTD